MFKRPEKRPRGPLVEDLEGRTLLSANLSGSGPEWITAPVAPYVVVAGMPATATGGEGGKSSAVAPVNAISLLSSWSGLEGAHAQGDPVWWQEGTGGEPVSEWAGSGYAGTVGNFGASGIDWLGVSTGSNEVLIIFENSGISIGEGPSIAQTWDAVPITTAELSPGQGSGESGVSVGTPVIISGLPSSVNGTGHAGSPGMLNSVGGATPSVPLIGPPVTRGLTSSEPGLGSELVASGEDIPPADFLGRPPIVPSNVGRPVSLSNALASPSLVLAGAFVEANWGLTLANASEESSSGSTQAKGAVDYAAAGRESEMIGTSVVPLNTLSAGLDSILVREATLGELSTGNGRVGRSAVFGEGRLAMVGPLSGAAIDEVLAIAKVGEEPAEPAGLAQPMGADLIGGFLPFHSDSIRQAVDEFVNELQELRASEAVLSRPTNVVVLTSTALGTMAAAEMVRRKLRSRPSVRVRSGGRSAGSGSETIGFPELPGSWSTRYT